MSENNRKDIFNKKLNYSYLGLISNKIRIGIIGAGRAGLIKAKHFAVNGCYVEILSREFSEEIIRLSHEYKENLKLINTEFNISFLEDKHIIIIALEDRNLIELIKKYCDDNYKIYIDSSNFIEGMGIVPVERKSKNIVVALNTTLGNPRGAVLVAQKVKEVIDSYDEFIEFTTKLRNNSKDLLQYKEEILKIIGTEEFEKLYKENNHEEFLREHLPNEIVDYIMS